MARLSAVENPQFSEKFLKHVFEMVTECNARIEGTGTNTLAAALEYRATEAGASFAETQTNEERAWRQLRRVHGNATPKTDFNRLEHLLAMCCSYQGHDKSKRTLLKELHRKGIGLTNVPFSVALPTIGATTKFEDEISKQMGIKPTVKAIQAGVNSVGATGGAGAGDGAGAGAGKDTCKICDTPGHHARDCIQFMQREGVCGHWFMHSRGIFKQPFRYETARAKKHERSNIEPAENAAEQTQVGAMATEAAPAKEPGGSDEESSDEDGLVTATRPVQVTTTRARGVPFTRIPSSFYPSSVIKSGLLDTSL